MPYNLVESGEGRAYLEGRFKRIRLGALSAYLLASSLPPLGHPRGPLSQKGLGFSLPHPAPETALAPSTLRI